jgi:hypothetical protein
MDTPLKKRIGGSLSKCPKPLQIRLNVFHKIRLDRNIENDLSWKSLFLNFDDVGVLHLLQITISCDESKLSSKYVQAKFFVLNTD